MQELNLEYYCTNVLYLNPDLELKSYDEELDYENFLSKYYKSNSEADGPYIAIIQADNLRETKEKLRSHPFLPRKKAEYLVITKIKYPDNKIENCNYILIL